MTDPPPPPPSDTAPDTERPPPGAFVEYDEGTCECDEDDPTNDLPVRLRVNSVQIELDIGRRKALGALQGVGDGVIALASLALPLIQQALGQSPPPVVARPLSSLSDMELKQQRMQQVDAVAFATHRAKALEAEAFLRRHKAERDFRAAAARPEGAPAAPPPIVTPEHPIAGLPSGEAPPARKKRKSKAEALPAAKPEEPAPDADEPETTG